MEEGVAFGLFVFVRLGDDMTEVADVMCRCGLSVCRVDRECLILL